MTNGIKQTFGEIQEEAKRCLYCVDAPCQKGCPANVDVAQFIRHLRYGESKKPILWAAYAQASVPAKICARRIVPETVAGHLSISGIYRSLLVQMGNTGQYWPR